MNDEKTLQEIKDESPKEPSKEQKRDSKMLLCDIALIIEGAAVIAGVSSPIWIWLTFVPVVQVVSILLIIGVIGAPIVGVFLGVLSLCFHPRKKHNILCSIVAIVVPVIVVTTIIILFSTRVLVISFM